VAVSDTHTIVISAPPPGCPHPLGDVSINGPSSGYTGTLYTFSSATTPPDVTEPLTYTWSPAPDSGQGTGEATYRWATPGVYTLALEARNCTSPSTVAVSDTHTVFISASSADGDAYEPDDTCAQASFIPANGVAQTRTFHDEVDKDWATFQATAGITYVIEARVPPTSAADIVLEPYEACEARGSFGTDPTFEPDTHLIFPVYTTGAYYLRLLNRDPGVYGPDVIYYLSVRALQDTFPYNVYLPLVHAGGL
jgi:hypothetical protein